MDEIDKIKSFIDATALHTQDGMDFGMSPGLLAKLLIVFGAGLHMREFGVDATRQHLRDQADKLETKRD